MAETGTTRLIGIAIPTLRELRGATLASLSARPSGEADAVDALREAGYAGGDAVYEAFEGWLREMHRSAAPDLELDEFGERAAEYFRAAGWGDVEFGSGQDDGTATLTIADCWEVDRVAAEGAPSCHVTTGMLAAFFGRLAGYPVSVLEIECRSTGANKCSFMMGNSDIMTYQWDSLR